MPYIGQQPAPKVVTSSHLADDVVTSAKIGDTAISGFSALGAEPADTDEILISDAGTLKRLDYSYIKGGGAHTLLSTTNISNASEDILALWSHQTLSTVSSDTTICLSLGDLPVNRPVSTRREPPIPSSPSSRFSE